MAKALIGTFPSYRGGESHHAHLQAQNARLRRRVEELEQLVLRLQQENDRLIADRALEADLQPA